MDQRTFQMDGQWSIVYYPFRPSGFSILLIGDSGHFVCEGDSYWLQHPSRRGILNHLKDSGYTLFSSHLYGANWGSKKAVELAEKLYFMMMKSEILNDKIHILAEGAGSLVALKLLELMDDKIRSVVLIDPWLSIKSPLLKERENKLYFKKWLREVAFAYDRSVNEIEEYIESMPDHPIPSHTPLKIIRVLGNNDTAQTNHYKQLNEQKRKNLEMIYLLPEKRYKIPYQIQQFFKKNEDTI
ncbi:MULTISPECIES: hypothetical protein [Bacillaceae]|uniref:Hydrolase n=1 Tax=Peribacillus huizhouensis TaxID=1501239 RepID=A0ABR6CJG2_9BACI|nr:MULTISPECIES: hypothetical protein [Bacillaceae]MBA9025199.1 hypothetical protein [Peribacillus huizhouensis]